MHIFKLLMCQTLIKTNVMHCFRYEAPSTLFFSTLFSPLIFLAAGTTFELPITFKPLQKVWLWF